MKNSSSTLLIDNSWLAVAIVAACFLVSDFALADTAILKACHELGKPVVTVGLPKAYEGGVHEFVEASEDILSAVARWNVCPAFAYGNDYQILDWLENGKVDAAVVSPFAAAILKIPRADSSETRYQMSEAWPFDRGGLNHYNVGIVFDKSRLRDENAGLFYDTFLRDLGNSDAQASRILLSSHWSVALPVLLSYTSERFEELGYDEEWAEQVGWRSFMQHLEFTINSNQPELSSEPVLASVSLLLFTDDEFDADTTLQISQNSFQDVFVYRQRQEKLFDQLQNFTLPSFDPQTVKLWLSNGEGEDTPVPEDYLSQFLDKNFSVHEIGSHENRHFRFGLNELWRILCDSENCNQRSFALVLTGGGVKAAYQTKIIDHLYGSGYLENKASTQLARGALQTEPIVVDHVIGTSGGALLGVFVSAIEEPLNLNLTDLLWENTDKERYIASHDIFPFIEMPRYVTLLISTLIFSFFIFIAQRSVGFWFKEDSPTVAAQYQVQESNLRRIPPRSIWVVLLLIAPWIIKSVNGEAGLQHVPAIAGMLYFFCVLIAMYSDSRLIFKDSFRIKEMVFRSLDVVLLFFGILLVSIPFMIELSGMFANGRAPLLGYIGRATLVCCVGFLVLFLAVHRVLARQEDDVTTIPASYIRNAFFVMFFIPIFAHLALWTFGQPMFELSWEFWWKFMLLSVLASLLILVLGHIGLKVPERNPIKVGLDFLTTMQPSSKYFTSARRYQRALVFFALALFWWNLVMAPGIYGNETAKAYFQSVYEEKAGIEIDWEDQDDEKPFAIKPKTPFVISATSLEKARERYVMIHPELVDPSCPQIEDVADGEFAELGKIDQRWLFADCTLTNQEYINIAFASGSPFPVFPATKVSLPSLEDDEWLVDGGFAHNIPIEAAKVVGAESVLVINASPLLRNDEMPDSIDSLWFGNLSYNLIRLFPYLFERSQIEDLLSAEQMLVATISPENPDNKWPGLTDYDPEWVQYLIDAAARDVDERIGVIESWGPPKCLFGGIQYPCMELKEITGVSGPS